MPVVDPRNGFRDLSDFDSGHPVPPPPVAEQPADPTGDAFDDARVYARETPFGGKGRSMRLVDPKVCKFPCTDHNHTDPVFTPQPDLDESLVGWTTQHVPTDRRGAIAKHCVLCWELHEDLSQHQCLVEALLNGIGPDAPPARAGMARSAS